ncbi:methyltransferase OMS1 [Phlyctema vagabunda]|uniref:Methyltransferase OMS1 n=1 Tax=Phlyctema vagabunda TaxID=108571 RepID=A0ABR4PBU2_9HELO
MKISCSRFLPLGRKGIAQGITANGVLSSRRRTFSATSFLQASKTTPKTVPKKAQRPIPEYKTPVRKHTANVPPTLKPQPTSLRYRGVVFGGVLLCVLSGYCTYLFVIYTRPAPAKDDVQNDVSSRYNAIARTFDADIDQTEYLMRLPKLRKKIAQQASGDVLEVSIGTGRNLEYYDWDFKGFNGVGKIDSKNQKIKRGKVKSFTAVDKSAEMLEIAHEKFSTMFPGILGVRWVIQDAADPLPGPPRSANERSGNKNEKYDTIVQTMGLCSVAEPVALLKNLGECLKEDTGRMLLLEHGKGTWDWLNGILDKGAPGHAKQYGCWWNRDIGEIVKESGLEVVELKRKHGGTTWYLELKKPKSKA